MSGRAPWYWRPLARAVGLAWDATIMGLTTGLAAIVGPSLAGSGSAALGDGWLGVFAVGFAIGAVNHLRLQRRLEG